MKKELIFIVKNKLPRLLRLDISIGFFAFFLCAAGFFSKAEENSRTKVLKSGHLQNERGKFGPSLSDTLNDVHQQKNKAERQLAQQFSRSSDQDHSPKEGAAKAPADKKAQFGDWELSLSDREEESLRPADPSTHRKAFNESEGWDEEESPQESDSSTAPAIRPLEENLKLKEKADSSAPSPIPPQQEQ